MPRSFFLVLLPVAFVLVTSYIAIKHFNHNKTVPKQTDSSQGFAVVELFTSEGCSSCPPADEAVAQLVNAEKSNVYVLGFHVDYWNSLGWKDAFSDAAYSGRQQAYAEVFRLNSIYTPQAVVNGHTEFTGSDTRRLNDAVEASLASPATNQIEISAKNAGAATVKVSFKVKQTAPGGQVCIALVQLHAQSRVQRGENSGKVLNHVNVVRDFKTIVPKETQGEVTMILPAGITTGDCKIIAFSQDEKLKITAAAEAAIQ